MRDTLKRMMAWLALRGMNDHRRPSCGNTAAILDDA